MLDIDDFKKFNDQYSYRIGDEVIARLAARLLENVREVDLVSRYGGDEFIILLVETDMESSKLAANRLIQAMMKSRSSPRLPAVLSQTVRGFHTFDSLIGGGGQMTLRDAERPGQGNSMVMMMTERRFNDQTAFR